MQLDASADATSGESLSFTGLVCIQDQHLTTPKDYAQLLPLARKASQEFEFRHATTASTTAVLGNNYSAQKMFANGHLQPHAVPICSDKSRTVKQTSSKRAMQSAQCEISISEIKSTSDKCTRKSNTKVRNRIDQIHTSRGKGFGQKIFKSFATPCRDCRTIEPTPLTREQLQ
ncbi:hypothetical protein M9H77_25927 [Catharanthus roseus]|uniref:Uncharacterized protein n=1 Tax=Catharanthus roseus TaxID=4058 RepID=A0ACC0AAC5_CATRO|nr:hypothetical protein M9H77_25927 [Catharanthus roseus]